MTLEAFLRLPEDEPSLEYWDGRVTQKVSPQGKHGMLQGGFLGLINGYVVPRKLAMAIPELRATYSGGSPVPDVAVYRWDRVPRDPDGAVADVFLEPPDIAVEIVSPEQSVKELGREAVRLRLARWTSRRDGRESRRPLTERAATSLPSASSLALEGVVVAVVVHQLEDQALALQGRHRRAAHIVHLVRPLKAEHRAVIVLNSAM